MSEELARALVPLAGVGLVDGIHSPMRRHLHVFLPQNELAERSIEREDIDACACRVNQLRCRAIKNVSRDQLLTSRHEDVLDSMIMPVRALLDGEDCAQRTVHVDIRRPVDRIVEHAVAIIAAIDRVMMRLVHFLGDETAYRVSLLERVEEDLVAPLVELLDLFALHVGLAGVAELAAERRRRELPRDTLGDELEALHDEREVRDRQRSRAFGHDMTRESDAAAHLQSFYSVRQVRASAAIIRAASSGPHEPAA